MSHPIFISVASEDIDSARQIKQNFSDDTAYFYEQTGVEGADWPEEIEQEVQACDCFVILWSAKYIAKEWTRRELVIAAKRIASCALQSWVIVQLDDTSLTTRGINPLTGIEEDLLSPFRARFRSLSIPFRVKSAQRAVGDALARVRPSRLPLLARTELQEQLRRTISIDYRQRRPLVFVSGLNGTGRRTLVKSVMESDFGHLTQYFILLEGSDGPDDFLLRLWLDVLIVPADEVERRLKALSDGKMSPKVLISAALEQVASNKGYLVISIDVSPDYLSAVPKWVNEYFVNLQARPAPLLFLILPRRIPERMFAGFPGAGSLHVPTLEDHESQELVFRLVQALDLHPARWTDSLVGRIVNAGGGNPELIRELVIQACRQASLEFLQIQLTPIVEHFLEHLGAWVEASLDRLGLFRGDGLLLLSVIDRLGVADLTALNDALESRINSVGEALYELRNCGLVEQLNDAVYRIPPLVRMRLNVHLSRGELGKITDECLRALAQRPLALGRDEYGATFILNALGAKLSFDTPLTEHETAFVSTALMFRTGLQSYWRGDYFHAFRLLQRVFMKRSSVSDEDTRLEITRYFGLAAIREEQDWHEAEHALSTEYVGSRHEEKASSMAYFMAAFSHRLDGEYDRACDAYEKALETISKGPHNNRQRGMILGDWVRSQLNIRNPNFELAVSRAKEAYELSSTPHNLDALVRALIAQTFMQDGLSESEVRSKLVELDKQRATLERKSIQAGLDFHRMRRIDLLEFKAIEAKRCGEALSLDLRDAIRAARQAYDATHRGDCLVRVWQLAFDNEVDRDLPALRRELQSFLDENPKASRRHRGHAVYWLIYSTDITLSSGKTTANSLLAKYKGLLPARYQTELRDYISNGRTRTCRPGLEHGW